MVTSLSLQSGRSHSPTPRNRHVLATPHTHTPPTHTHTTHTHTHNGVPAQVQPSDAKPKEERIKSFDFDAWSKFDGEKEAAKVDSEEPQVSVTQDKPDIPIQLSEKGTRNKDIVCSCYG